jgi:hypothetical protein
MFKIRSFGGKNLKWWRRSARHIDFDPDFQRTARVWSDRDKAFLIDSILNGFDIPKLYIADFSTHDIPALNVSRKRYAIIDGKQRLSTILAFFDDGLPLRKEFRLDSDRARDLGNLRFSDLKRDHPDLVRRIEHYVLDVKAVETDDREKINEVFLRLNKASKALNGAEVRNAIIGKAVDAIRDLGKHRFFVRRIAFSTHRSQERNAAAKVLLLEYQGGPTQTMKRDLDEFVYTINAQSTSRLNKACRRVKEQLGRLCDVFRNQDPLLTSQGNIAIYYLFISKLNVADRRRARDFLESFERMRARNRRRPVRDRDQDLDSYDLASRSNNHKWSLKERLRVMRKRFARWKTSAP